ncbi:hypothetical protein ACFLXU_00790 [Chloroflexota bacterium]
MDYTVDYFKERLTTFLANNPKSNIVKAKEIIVLEEPWEDDSVSIRLPVKIADKLIEVLNSLVLPPRFSCIFHVDKRIAEFIWGPQAKNSDIISRVFSFNFDGHNYKCYFAEVSDRLELLARCGVRRKYNSSTEYRNLLSLRQHYLDKIKKGSELTEDSIPVSFFIDGFESYDEPLLIDISKNLNFNMKYFDRESPLILIHTPPSSIEIAKEQIRFIDDSFPNVIASKSKDSLLLDLVSAALRSDVRMSYLYYYQVIERGSYFYISDTTKSTLAKIINSPDIQANSNSYIDRIVETVLQDSKSDEESRIEKVIKSLCNPTVLWKEISTNISFFSKPTTFDGGFATNPIIDESGNFEYFCSCWHPAIIHQLRHIRNALAHGREKTFGSVIHPTPHNDQLLIPWVALIGRVAEEVILYSKID